MQCWGYFADGRECWHGKVLNRSNLNAIKLELVNSPGHQSGVGLRYFTTGVLHEDCHFLQFAEVPGGCGACNLRRPDLWAKVEPNDT